MWCGVVWCSVVWWWIKFANCSKYFFSFTFIDNLFCTHMHTHTHTHTQIQYKDTALHTACREGHTRVVQVLITASVNLNAKNKVEWECVGRREPSSLSLSSSSSSSSLSSLSSSSSSSSSQGGQDSTDVCSGAREGVGHVVGGWS